MPLRKTLAATCARHALLYAVLVSVGACDLFNSYEKPAPAVPQAYVEQPGDVVALGWPDKEWWKSFNSAELNTLEDLAMKNNHDLGAAIARVKQADAQVRINGAALLPTLEADAGATRSYSGGGNGSSTVITTGSGTTGTTTGGSGGNRHRTTYNATLQAGYEIDFWGKNRSAVAAAEAARDAQAYDQQVVALSIQGSVASIYFDLLAARGRLDVAQENLKNANDTLAALQKRFEAGVISRLDVAQQSTVVAQEGAALAPLQLAVSKDRDALALLTGQLPESLTLAENTTLDTITMPVVPAGLPSQLLQRRPDVAEAEAQLIQAHANINVARAEFFPSIGLTATGGYQSDALHQLFTPESALYSFGGNLVQPIFEGGALFGQLDFSKAQYEELTHTYYQTVLTAFADTEDALAGLQHNGEQFQSQQEVVKTSADAYTLSQRQFKGGIVDITSVLNTQRALFSAQDGAVQARGEQLVAAATLMQALGGGWQQPGAESVK